ncbi:hypothetical protein CRX67_06700 [Enterobacteriaceae bacterium A-F18]|uniref:Uncharacterized protein n=2 Tax=Enterobacteriaceae TaxID=543 RepID=A0ABN6LS06_9ENTR|nr:hypothetical protein DFO55_101125 [Grimontella sp. AG753]QIH62832.1 hypothetical protein CRX67_06700 [Enterobacteriaceae bacterium A-F18]BBE76843.1 hypothetical protein MRY16398_18990 [Phytobacter sp. MRY16-398]BDD50315.1 hypothetical protein PDTA9734_18020 [Phytobacter diazotrophicus]BEG81343.1 hypothetical protein PDTA9730_17990 [Phytobacter diazotrophicus]
MSNNTEIHVFTDESLRQHDREIAIKVNQATVTHVVRKLNAMNAGQQVRAYSKVGREELMFDDATLDEILSHVKK